MKSGCESNVVNTDSFNPISFMRVYVSFYLHSIIFVVGRSCYETLAILLQRESLVLS